jgi:hypothetical protein
MLVFIEDFMIYVDTTNKSDARIYIYFELNGSLCQLEVDKFNYSLSRDLDYMYYSSVRYSIPGKVCSTAEISIRLNDPKLIPFSKRYSNNLLTLSDREFVFKFSH